MSLFKFLNRSYVHPSLIVTKQALRVTVHRITNSTDPFSPTVFFYKWKIPSGGGNELVEYITACLKVLGHGSSFRTTSNNMKSCLVFLFALGLTSATETTVKKLTVFGKSPFARSLLELLNMYFVNFFRLEYRMRSESYKWYVRKFLKCSVHGILHLGYHKSIRLT